MKTLLNYQVHSNLDGQTNALVLNETAKLESVFYNRNRSLSKSEAGLNSIPSKNLIKSESFNLEDSALKEQENSKSQNKNSWDILCQVINCKVAFKKQFNGKKYNWIQLAGHSGRFKPGDREGYILKIMDDLERNCLTLLQSDILAQFVPKIDRINLKLDGQNNYTEMQDLLYGFINPCIMDIKIGVRTFIIDESNEKETKPRNDLYDKLIKIDPNEPTEEEHRMQAINKRRYMTWRERCTCSATLGFRIEAVKMIGSSLLFVHDQNQANIWMIDFGKTRQLPEGVHLRHDVRWEEGSLEDGYLIGIKSLIDIFKEIIEN